MQSYYNSSPTILLRVHYQDMEIEGNKTILLRIRSSSPFIIKT